MVQHLHLQKLFIFFALLCETRLIRCPKRIVSSGKHAEKEILNYLGNEAVIERNHVSIMYHV